MEEESSKSIHVRLGPTSLLSTVEKTTTKGVFAPQGRGETRFAYEPVAAQELLPQQFLLPPKEQVASEPKGLSAW